MNSHGKPTPPTPAGAGTKTPMTDRLWRDYFDNETGLLFVEIKTKELEEDLNAEKSDKARILLTAQNAHEKKSELEAELTSLRRQAEADRAELARLNGALDAIDRLLPDDTEDALRPDGSWSYLGTIVKGVELMKSQLATADKDRERMEAVIEMAVNQARENLISSNIIDGKNNRGGHFWDIERDAKFIRNRATKLLEQIATLQSSSSLDHGATNNNLPQ